MKQPNQMKNNCGHICIKYLLLPICFYMTTAFKNPGENNEAFEGELVYFLSPTEDAWGNSLKERNGVFCYKKNDQLVVLVYSKDKLVKKNIISPENTERFYNSYKSIGFMNFNFQLEEVTTNETLKEQAPKLTDDEKDFIKHNLLVFDDWVYELYINFEGENFTGKRSTIKPYIVFHSKYSYRFRKLLEIIQLVDANIE